MYGQFSSIQYLYFYSDFRRNYLRKCMQMSVYYNTEKITNHSKNINFWKCQRLCEHSYELSQQRSNSVNKRTGFTHRVIVNSMEKGITKKTPCITKCCTELLGINTHVCSRFTTGYYCYFNKFIKCVEITDQKVDASSVQSVMDIYNFKQFKCSCFCFQSHYYTRISQGVIFALCWKLCINIWTQNFFQQQHQQSFIQDEESLTNILKEFAVCIGSIGQEICTTPYLNLSACVQITQAMSCRQREEVNKCEIVEVIALVTKCTDLKYSIPLASSQISELINKKNLGCYFNSNTQQCEVIIKGNLAEMEFLNRSQINMVGQRCRWFRGQFATSISCNELKYVNLEACGLVTFSKEVCKYSIDGNSFACSQMRRNTNGCYFDKINNVCLFGSRQEIIL
ncbi:unnamed protein product [Paramecium octaurelia]|uniref:Uncharacterized protein n=1 Tax=Paramecium octaurelia TaxID=43137 RepID=A0A8S1WEK2_PAROT|nr:unnamed protein product [Paramecium octaurelia]